MLLYYISDRKAFPGADVQQRAALLGRVSDCARAGVNYIQLREKDLSARELERLARQAVQAVRDNSATTKLLVNSRTDVALACGADGVHLPADELAASEVRALWMKRRDSEPLVGVSAHSVDDLRCLQVQGADFAVLAPIFEKVETGTPGIGLEVLRAASQLPVNGTRSGNFAVLALGGVTVSNARSCIEAGAAGVAGIRLFQRGDVFETVRRLREL
jgi:thiamine-phosphate pyrophosphorylase